MLSLRYASSKILLLPLLIALAACTGPQTKVGSTKTNSERIALWSQSRTLEADAALKGVKPSLPSTVNNTVWEQAGYDPTHSMPNAAMSSHPEEIWSEDIGSGSDSNFKILARPVVADGRVFAMDSHGAIEALDAKTGEELWSFETTPEDYDDDAIGGGLGVHNGVLFATTGFGEVIALKAEDGTVIWRRMLPSPIRAAPTIAGGHVYAVSIDNQLQALDERTGQPLWQHNGFAESATLMGASNPAVVDDSVIIAYSSGEIFDLRGINGRASWTYTLGTVAQVGSLPAIADIRGLPVVDHGRIYAISHSGRMACIDERSGERVWEADVGGVNTPVVTLDTVFVLDKDSHLVAVARDSGRILWIHDLPRVVDPEDRDSDSLYWTGPILANDRLWLVNSAGELASFSAENGEARDSYDIGSPVYVSPVVADGIIYIVAEDGHLIALK